MLSGFLQIIFFLLAGEAVAFVTRLPLPGAVLGMALLLSWLLIKKHKPSENLEAASQGLLQFLSVLFVPAGVGIILHIERIRHEWLAILASVVFATLITAGLTALLLQKLHRSTAQPHD